MSVNFLIPELGDIKNTIRAQFKTNPNLKYFLWCAAKPQNFMEAFGLEIKQVCMLIMSFLGRALNLTIFLCSSPGLCWYSQAELKLGLINLWYGQLIFITVDNLFYYRRRNTNLINLSRQI